MKSGQEKMYNFTIMVHVANKYLFSRQPFNQWSECLIGIPIVRNITFTFFFNIRILSLSIASDRFGCCPGVILLRELKVFSTGSWLNLKKRRDVTSIFNAQIKDVRQENSRF